MTGYSSATFQSNEQAAYCTVVENRTKTTPGSCAVTKVTDLAGSSSSAAASPAASDAAAASSPAPAPAADTATAQTVTPTLGGRRRRLLSGGGIEVTHTITLSDPKDVVKAQLVFEALVTMAEELESDEGKAALVEQFKRVGLEGDDPINNPIGVTGAKKPVSSHSSPAFTEPSFGKDDKPLPPVNPPKPTKPPTTPTTPTTPILGSDKTEEGAPIGAIVGGVVGGLIFIVVVAVVIIRQRGKASKPGAGFAYSAPADATTDGQTPTPAALDRPEEPTPLPRPGD